MYCDFQYDVCVTDGHVFVLYHTFDTIFLISHLSQKAIFKSSFWNSVKKFLKVIMHTNNFYFAFKCI